MKLFILALLTISASAHYGRIHTALLYSWQVVEFRNLPVELRP